MRYLLLIHTTTNFVCQLGRLACCPLLRALRESQIPVVKSTGSCDLFWKTMNHPVISISSAAGTLIPTYHFRVGARQMKWEGSSNDIAMAFSELNWGIKFAWFQICKQYYAPHSRESWCRSEFKSCKRLDDKNICLIILFSTVQSQAEVMKRRQSLACPMRV